MTTLAPGVALSAFRTIPSPSPADPFSGLVPINTPLIPPPLYEAFAIPRLEFDQRNASDYGTVIPPPFRTPLPFGVRYTVASHIISSIASQRLMQVFCCHSPASATELPAPRRVQQVPVHAAFDQPSP
jgi:hypothetical protein